MNCNFMGFLDNIFGKRKVEQESKPTEKSDAYDNFWGWFKTNSKEFYKIIESKNRTSIDEAFFTPIKAQLKQFDNNIYFLVGKDAHDNVELIFTAEGVVKLFPLIERIIERAPKINKWKFTAHKPAVHIPDFEIHIGAYTFNENNISFIVNQHENYPDLIDIELVYSDSYAENKDDVLNGCFIFLDNYLGELKFASEIDEINMAETVEGREIIPISKLKEYLIWREKEFVERYEGVRKNTAQDTYVNMEGTLQSGAPLMAVVNETLMQWDAKPSHPWIIRFDIFYAAANENGLPSSEDFAFMNSFEDFLMDCLKDEEGYLNIGRQTADGLREIFFACKDFRKPIHLFEDHKKDFQQGSLKLELVAYKDKYWKSLGFFMPSYD